MSEANDMMMTDHFRKSQVTGQKETHSVVMARCHNVLFDLIAQQRKEAIKRLKNEPASEPGHR
jgi:hypothetical protein